MENKRCSICLSNVGEDAPILTMGGYGNPRYLCTECSAELDRATLSRDTEEIERAMSSISRKMLEFSPDTTTFDTIGEILSSAKERAERIADGSYDFSFDEEVTEESAEAFDDIPDELTESEEDKELDRIESEKQAKIDKFLDYVNIGLVIGLIAAVAYIVVKLFF